MDLAYFLQTTNLNMLFFNLFCNNRLPITPNDIAPPVFVPYDIPFKNIQDMAYGTNEIVTYGMRSLPYGIISGGGFFIIISKAK